MKRTVKTKGAKSGTSAVMPSATTPIIGWREWVVLPQFAGARIKAKIDTGAKTSALHAWNMRMSVGQDSQHVIFDLIPGQNDEDTIIRCRAPLIAVRAVRNSGGQIERRPIVAVTITLGGASWLIELSLTRRDEMGFRMLLGREALVGRYLIDPGRSFLLGR